MLLRVVLFAVLLTATLESSSRSDAEDAEPLPNVVLIMTDNHGPWTLGCYGNQEIRTPNIDRLASKGTLFTDAYSSNAVCSPTRATFLTGLLPSQHGVHRYLSAGHAQIGPDAYYTLSEFETLPKILKAAGYKCGLTGKWHLGNNLYPQDGFEYWITKPHGHSQGFYDQEVIEDGKIRNEPEYLTDLWTRHGINFIEQNKDERFFLFLTYNGPYGLGGSMLERIGNRHGDYYSQLEMESFPREEPHPWLRGNRNLVNNVKAMRKYAAETSAIDDGVGQIMAALEKHGLSDDTLVVFTADQGLSGGHSGFWGMGDHTKPITAYDLTMWIPLIFRHPNRITAGQRSSILVSNYDFMPTLLDYLGLADQMADQPKSPGRLFTDVLKGREVQWQDIVYYEFENVRSVRTKQWKYIERIHEEPNELYDLVKDPGERTNLYDQERYAEEQEELKTKLDDFFDQYAERR